ncbi:MotA/TolQ/ExbB proton channel family protein [Flagellatimonas centrodinii]|uniref:MotA/TolQ/ExbB proton channel family protein n=1 Tax=Flagellatimonas centrodinii TaxID=2806210 RepID=UPI001FFD1AC1|nr:MotA/TolQ/ExbB proton channel family protein [Flagellatimonas centrodinii]ULQ47312.1 MotA/TolQ/ExbB proton channel family protein [Flagellatimonas centrodinii]
MSELLRPLTDIRDFVELGGPVVQVLLVVAILLWTLILERVIYYRRAMPAELARIEADWQARGDHRSWFAHKIKQGWVSAATRRIRGPLPLIKVLVALCPMIGLLGTVTGMIQVFNVMSALGTGNARAMASGVSAATLPTMAGMVVAISGLYFVSRFEQVVERESHRLNDHLVTH